MTRKICVGFVLAAFFWATAAYCQTPVSSNEIINRSADFTGKTVVYRGEVVGDVMRRGSYAWVNVYDGQNAIGIWVPFELARQISRTGGYKFSGDIVEVGGVFSRVCREHGGDMDIHAETMRIFAPGAARPVGVNETKKTWMLRLLGAVAVLWILSLLKRR